MGEARVTVTGYVWQKKIWGLTAELHYALDGLVGLGVRPWLLRYSVGTTSKVGEDDPSHATCSMPPTTSLLAQDDVVITRFCYVQWAVKARGSGANRHVYVTFPWHAVQHDYIWARSKHIDLLWHIDVTRSEKDTVWDKQAHQCYFTGHTVWPDQIWTRTGSFLAQWLAHFWLSDWLIFWLSGMQFTEECATNQLCYFSNFSNHFLLLL